MANGFPPSHVQALLPDPSCLKLNSVEHQAGGRAARPSSVLRQPPVGPAGGVPRERERGHEIPLSADSETSGIPARRGRALKSPPLVNTMEK
jgi:hypothetical protein